MYTHTHTYSERNSSSISIVETIVNQNLNNKAEGNLIEIEEQSDMVEVPNQKCN